VSCNSSSPPLSGTLTWLGIGSHTGGRFVLDQSVYELLALRPAYEEAEENFRKAIVLQTPLVKQFPDVPYYALWMATFRIAHADALIRQNRSAQALVELEEALSSLLRQYEERPETLRPHNLLALGYSGLAMALRETGERDRPDEAPRKAEEERNGVRGSP
jgi:tetratricopeptide (TPR) repeat protein